MNIRIAILEDNPFHFKQLSSLINSWALSAEHSIYIHWFQNGFDILNSEIIYECHLLFSDIELKETTVTDFNSNMDYLNGIHICSTLRENGFNGDIIFLTAFREYVFEGYNVQALNYLLKPISEEAVVKCLNKFVSLHFLDYYYFHKNTDIIQIPFNDIISISRAGHECLIQTMSDIYTERFALKDYKTRLPKQFMRCHKSCIINLNHVVSLSGYTIKLSNKQSQTVGRLYLDELKKELIKMSNDNFI